MIKQTPPLKSDYPTQELDDNDNHGANLETAWKFCRHFTNKQTAGRDIVKVLFRENLDQIHVWKLTKHEAR